jgi:hypothetical protein
LKIVGILFALALAVSLVLVPATVLAQDGEGTGGLGQCQWDPWPKWWDNPIAHDLYLQHWGRTPIQAMSRLSGLCGPATLCAQGHAGITMSPIGTSCPDPAKSKIYGDPNACYGGCPACRTEEQGALATCEDPVACKTSQNTVSCPATGQPTGGYECPETPTLEQTTCCCCWGVSLAFANKSWAGADIGTHPRITSNGSTNYPYGHPAHLGTSECTGGGKGGDWGISGCPHTECCALSWCLQDNCFTGEKCAPQ